MTDLNTTNEAAVRAWCDANGMVLVSGPSGSQLRMQSGRRVGTRSQTSLS
jgi:hypothetical protein